MNVCMEEETNQRLDLQLQELVQEEDGKDFLPRIQTQTEIPGEGRHQLRQQTNVTGPRRSSRWMSNVVTG